MNTVTSKLNPSALPHYFDINNSPWVSDDISQWKEILHDEKMIRYKKNTRIFASDDILNHIFIVQSGLVVISLVSAEGTEKHVYFQGIGSIIGDPTAFLGKKSNVTAYTITDCCLFKISVEKVRTAALNPILDRNLNKSLCKKVSVLLSQVYNLSFLSSSARVAVALLHLVDQYGTQTEQGYQISLRITHEQLARLVNTSRVTISQILKKMERNQILAKSSGKLLVIDMNKLYKMA